MKRRKRTNSKVPAKGRLREMSDATWSLAVKADADNRCEICGKSGDLNSHHLIPRQHTATRYLLENGLCLCKYCHQFCPDRSPHQAAAGFLLWLEEHMPIRYEWLVAMTQSGEYRNFNGTKNAAYYMDVLRDLRQYIEPEEFERIVGIKFSRYLLE